MASQAISLRFFPINPRTQKTSFEPVYVMMLDQKPDFPRGLIPFADDPSGDMFLYSVKPEVVWEYHVHFPRRL